MEMFWNSVKMDNVMKCNYECIKIKDNSDDLDFYLINDEEF